MIAGYGHEFQSTKNTGLMGVSYDVTGVGCACNCVIMASSIKEYPVCSNNVAAFNDDFQERLRERKCPIARPLVGLLDILCSVSLPEVVQTCSADGDIRKSISVYFRTPGVNVVRRKVCVQK